jgi:hypothetical protein
MPYEVNKTQNPSILCDNNFVSPTAFQLLIDRLRYPNAEFSVQVAEIPSIDIGGANFASPQVNVMIASDRVTYSPLTIQFLVDEHFVNYKEIHDWMMEMVTERHDYDKLRTINLLVLTSHNNVARRFEFVGAYPVSLSAIPFDASATDISYLTASATFAYSYFKII